MDDASFPHPRLGDDDLPVWLSRLCCAVNGQQAPARVRPEGHRWTRVEIVAPRSTSSARAQSAIAGRFGVLNPAIKK